MAGKMPFERSRWPWLYALVATAVGAAAAWALVAPSAASWEKAGYSTGPELKFAMVLAAVAGGVAFFIARRLLDGPEVRNDELALDFGGAPAPRLAELEDRLSRRGYRLRWTGLDERGAETGPASPGLALIGSVLLITESRARERRAGLVLRISQPRAGENGLGLLEIRDSSGVYDELSKYVLVALAELLPGLRFRRFTSGLEAEEPAALLPFLPERPHHLPGR